MCWGIKSYSAVLLKTITEFAAPVFEMLATIGQFASTSLILDTKREFNMN
jgi:hypothetical protein